MLSKTFVKPLIIGMALVNNKSVVLELYTLIDPLSLFRNIPKSSPRFSAVVLSQFRFSLARLLKDTTRCVTPPSKIVFDELIRGKVANEPMEGLPFSP